MNRNDKLRDDDYITTETYMNGVRVVTRSPIHVDPNKKRRIINDIYNILKPKEAETESQIEK